MSFQNGIPWTGHGPKTAARQPFCSCPDGARPHPAPGIPVYRESSPARIPAKQGPWIDSAPDLHARSGVSIRVNFVVTAAIAAAKLVRYKCGKVFAPQIGREKKNFGHLFFGQNWAFFGPKQL